MKKCSCCSKTLDLSYFNKKPDGKYGVSAVCKSCLWKRTKRYREENTELTRKQHIQRTFGLSWECYVEMFLGQSCQCAICKTSLKLHKTDMTHDGIVPDVDHCHSTGNVRGLLCPKCNRALGLFNDNITAIRLAAEYLEKDIK